MALHFHMSNFTAKLTNPNYIEQLHFEVINPILMIKQSLYYTLTTKQSLDLILMIKQSPNSTLII